MHASYDDDEKKAIVHAGEYVCYDADGNYTVSEEPTAFVANPIGY